MTSEKSQIKFAKSERTGELIGFVSRDSKTRQLKGVRENYALGKQICILSEDLKGTIEPNVLYSVELKPMHKAKGYVVVAATPVQFPATVETIIVPKNAVQGYSVIRQQDHLSRPEGRQKCNEPNARWRAPNPQRAQGHREP